MPPSHAYEKMVCIYLDVLGTEGRQANFSESLKIHELFHGEFKEQQVIDNQNKRVIYERKIFSFSDCAFILYRYNDETEDDKKDFVLLSRTALNNTGIAFLRFMNEGFFVRGGMCYGDAFYTQDGCFGPAVVLAARLEEKKATYPSIVIDPCLGGEIFDRETKIKKEIELDNNKGLEIEPAQRVSRLVIKYKPKERCYHFFYNLVYWWGYLDSISLSSGTITHDSFMKTVKKNIAQTLLNNQDDKKIKDKMRAVEELMEMGKYVSAGEEICLTTMGLIVSDGNA